MRDPKWYRAWAGDRKALPKSDGQGVAMAQEVLSPLQAQIAVFFGEPEGDINVLQRGVMKLAKGEAIVCQCCKRNVFTERHLNECQIVLLYKEVTSKPPVPKH